MMRSSPPVITVPPAEDGTGEAAVLAIADPDQVVSVELKGIGTVTDPEQCASLLQDRMARSVCCPF